MAQSKAKKKLGGPRIGGDGPRQAKADAVAEVERRVGASSAVLLSEYRGLTVSELAELRSGLRSAGADYKVYKNTLAKRAADNLGLSALHEHLEGPVAFTFTAGDPVLAAKVLSDYAKKAPALILKAGILEGRVLSPAEVTRLGSLESRDVMLAKAAGLFVSPLQRAANLFAAGFNQLGSLLVQVRDKLPAEAGTSGPSASEPDVATDDSPSADGAPVEQQAEDPGDTSTEEAPAEPSE